MVAASVVGAAVPAAVSAGAGAGVAWSARAGCAKPSSAIRAAVTVATRTLVCET